MIGVPYNPDVTIFLLSQSLNANQLNPNVPDAGNITNHNLLFDTNTKTLIWVDTKTNLIVQETSTPPALPTKVVGEQHIITGTTVILNNTPLAGTFAGYIQSQRAGIGVGYYILSVVGNLVTFNEDRTGELFIGDYEY